MADQQRCNNCRRDIPASSYMMHSLHCARNIALCTVCDEPVPRAELEQHKQELHSSKQCPDCGEKVEASKLEEHKTSLCQKRVECCPYCALNQEVSEMKAHTDYCGSRTEKCEDCKEIIMLKNWEMHINSNHGFIKLKDEPGPKPSWEMEEELKRRNNMKCDYMSSLYSTRPDPRYDDPRTSTTAQRKNFTDTELFNNQDLYSSKRHQTASTQRRESSSNSTSVSYSSSTSESTSVRKSASSSIVNSALHRSTSSTRVSTLATAERRSSTKTEEVGGVNTTLSKNTASIVAKVLANNKDVANAHVNGTSIPGNAVDDEKLPCEFCEAMIPMYKLHSHQAECVNSSNVRGGGGHTSAYSRYSNVGRASSMRETSQQREVSRGLDRSATSSRVNNFLRQSSTETPTESETPPSVNGCTPNRKVSPTSNSHSIVNRFITSPDQKKTSYLPDSPPSYDRESSSYSTYAGRSSYLKEERVKDDRYINSTSSKPKKEPVVAGLYENDMDREQLRQALSGLRKCPMELADDPDNNDGSFFPCEFCGDPYPCEFLMRHQMSCDLNPQPVSSGNGFDYNSIKNSVTQNLVESQSKPHQAPASVVPRGGNTDADDERTEQILNNTRRLSRSNSVIERSYSRSNVRASSVSRTSSFADRSYGTRTNLGTTSTFAIADYTSAVRRSSVFDGYAGYSIYSSISEGLDQITYGGRTSRRNSITETNYSLSRRGSFSTRNDLPLAALQASLEASKATRDEEERSERRNANDHVNGQASAYIQNGHHSHLTNGFSRQNSSQGESPRQTIDSPFGATSGTDLNRSESKKLRRRASIKHSQSGYKLERKVSFHDHTTLIGDENEVVTLDENGLPVQEKIKKKRTPEEKEARRREKEEKRERKEAKRAARGQSKDRKCKSEGDAVVRQPPPQAAQPKQTVQGGELLAQVSQRLAEVERQQQQQPTSPPTHLSPLPSSSLLPLDSQASRQPNNQASAPRNQEKEPASTAANNLDNGHADVLTLNSEQPPTVVSRTRKASKGPAPRPPVDVVDNLVNLEDEPSAVTMREGSDGAKACSKRNSLDNKSVQTLAKDLAAECAKAYELMESSLSKLTNDFSVGPFGLTPKNKKKSFARPAPVLN